MITGHKPSGYFQTHRGDGIRVEGHTHQCAHCGYTWEYQPGSGIRRGWCLRHQALLCGRAECEAQQRRMLASLPDKTLSCLAWTDLIEYQRDRYAQDPRYEVLPSGIVIAKP